MPFLFWIIQIAIWSFAVLAGTFLALNWKIDPTPAFFFGALRASTGFIVTSFAFRPVVQWLMKRQIGGAQMVIHLFALAGIASCLDGIVSIQIADLAGMPAVKDYFPGLSALLRWPLYGTWALLYWLLCEWQNSRETALRLAQAEAARVRTELDLLRAQIDPHFTFNVLNTILAVADKPETVSAMTMALSDHLQFSLHRSSKDNTVATDLEAVRNYLQLEKYRFEEDLEYRIDVAPELLPFPIPLGTLLVPVENAVKYGQRTSPRPLRVEVLGRIDRDLVRFEIRNTGEWIPPDNDRRLGIGLANLEKTVAHFGGSISLPKNSGNEDWVTVAIHFPARNSTRHAVQLA